MTRDKFDYTHADNGTKPASSLGFDKNERPDSEHFDWWWTEVIKKINLIWDELKRLDSDDDGVVDKANSATLVKGNDVDSNGDGKMDAADQADYAQDADQVDGHDVYVQSSAPSDPDSGDIWIDTS